MKVIAQFTCLFLCALSVGWCDEVVIKPDALIQAKLDEIAIRLAKAGSEAEIKEALTALKQLEKGESDKAALVQQLIYYLRHGANTEERGYGAIILFNNLTIDNTTKVLATLPCLDTTDAGLQRIAFQVLGTVDSPDGEGVDYTVYEGILRNSTTNPCPALVKYMYLKSPDAALSTMANIYLKKDARKALMDEARDKDEAKALDLLAKRSEWWVHLYVAEKMKKNPKLRSSAILERLKKSKHPLVREAIKEIEKD